MNFVAVFSRLFRSSAPLLILALVFTQSNSALADESGDFELDLAVDYRFWSVYTTPFDIDPSGSEWDPDVVGLQRLRVGVQGGFETLTFEVEADLFFGTLFGERPNIAPDATVEPPDTVVEAQSFIPRKLFLAWTSPIGLIRLGHQTSNWGLGLLANNGDADDEFAFGEKRVGDLVERFVFVTKPLLLFTDSGSNTLADHLMLALGADLVFRDENANLIDGDLAYQFIASLFYRQEDMEFGVYGVYRHQEDDDGAELEVGAVDVAARIDTPLLPGTLEMMVAFEGTLLFGDTDRVSTEEAPERVNVLAWAAVMETRWRFPGLFSELRLHAGYLSGDANLDDDTIYRYTADPDYRVGLILYPHYLAGMTAMAVERAADPDRIGYAPKGLNGVATNGRVENTIFLWPQVVFQTPCGFHVALGFLAAWTAEPVSDPYFTTAQGGEPYGYMGGPTTDNRFLGWELDAAIGHEIPLWRDLKLGVRLEYGILFPGAVFATKDGNNPDPVHLAQGRIVATW